MISPGPSTASAPRMKKREVGVPKFLRSLYEMLETEDMQIISWTMDGSSVQVLDRHKLENVILPKYFKHSKFTSFQRQLNYFGFKKNTKFRSHMYTFTHPYFRQNRKDLLSKISRHYGNDDDHAHASADEHDANFLDNETTNPDEPPFSLDPMLHLNAQDLDTLMCLMDPEDDVSPQLRIEAPPQTFETRIGQVNTFRPASPPPLRTPPRVVPVSPPASICLSPLPSNNDYAPSRRDAAVPPSFSTRPPSMLTQPPYYQYQQPSQLRQQPPQPRQQPQSRQLPQQSRQQPQVPRHHPQQAPFSPQQLQQPQIPREQPQQPYRHQSHPAFQRQNSEDDYGVLYEAASMFL
ncbi:unnamed protein product [Aphanomyces euteiches]|uniref:HSF-type DNA-binding domain-containing protein n=1 Tax=Aphanomyces euteiches TaxID=100861 RepID=A0A6G0WHH3_9STRA|nr:hypothetical protein Ae201684_015221 [Aphanomyces euteiches]KAH9080055.1 hypothetical protein Ae201684P_020634 [Aphanomyces euteiches]KAH9148602.1 hypothetical protein AeRB84_008087 [Aphanomyces euteiches]